ncbi:MAG: acyl-ACP--UDP-N-acetylglucosamine O-acyltransferase [Pelagibacterales bacterium]|nr:acyl-ACP--UDP-N-acetylglucosamine O-acyltransferase [Pelagibacterales bacterium]
MSTIHNTAIIGSDVVIGENVAIGAYSIIEDGVKIANNNIIKSSVFITGNTDIGTSNIFHPFCSIGSAPQDLKFKNEITKLSIGNNNIFREYANINVGTEGGGGITLVGNNSLFMVGAHIAHDCIVGNNIVMANQATIAGHVSVDDNAILGGLSAVHQFCRIGKLSMIGGMSAVEHDVVPYGLVTGNRAHLLGLNIVGLRRANYTNETIKDLKIIFEKIFNSNEIKTESIANNNTKNELAKNLVDFIQADSSRGLCTFK